MRHECFISEHSDFKAYTTLQGYGLVGRHHARACSAGDHQRDDTCMRVSTCSVAE